MVAMAERTFGVLTVVTIIVIVATLVALVTRRVPDWLRDEMALWLAAGIAIVASAGSLFFSEVANYVPCVLCWYQRIAMYPLAVILVVAAIRRDNKVWLTSVPIAAIGLVISAWHVAIERRPSLGGVCDPAAPCSLRWVEEFGLFTLPMMAGIGFLAIILLSLAARGGGTQHTDDREVAEDGDRSELLT